MWGEVSSENMIQMKCAIMHGLACKYLYILTAVSQLNLTFKNGFQSMRQYLKSFGDLITYAQLFTLQTFFRSQMQKGREQTWEHKSCFHFCHHHQLSSVEKSRFNFVVYETF